MSNPTFPWFPFYARDWLTDVKVRAMPLAVRGAFVELLCLQWENGELPNDPEELRVLVGVHEDSWASWWRLLEPKFPEGGIPPRRRNRKLEELREEKLEKRRRQSAGGRQAQAKRAGKPRVRASDDERHQTSDIRVKPSSVLGAAREGDFDPQGTRVGPQAGGRYRYPDDFEAFWQAYPPRNDKRVGKKTTYRLWNKVPLEQHGALRKAVHNYSQSKIVRVDGKPRDPERFLRNDYWQDWIDGPGTDEHIEERDRIARWRPAEDDSEPPADLGEVSREFGGRTLSEALRRAGERADPASEPDSEPQEDSEEEGGGAME